MDSVTKTAVTAICIVTFATLVGYGLVGTVIVHFAHKLW